MTFNLSHVPDPKKTKKLSLKKFQKMFINSSQKTKFGQQCLLLKI